MELIKCNSVDGLVGCDTIQSGTNLSTLQGNLLRHYYTIAANSARNSNPADHVDSIETLQNIQLFQKTGLVTLSNIPIPL